MGGQLQKGDILTLEVEVLRAWDDGTVTFSLFGYPGLTNIPGDSPQIVGIEKVKQKISQRMAEA